MSKSLLKDLASLNLGEVTSESKINRDGQDCQIMDFVGVTPPQGKKYVALKLKTKGGHEFEERIYRDQKNQWMVWKIAPIVRAAKKELNIDTTKYEEILPLIMGLCFRLTWEGKKNGEYMDWTLKTAEVIKPFKLDELEEPEF